MLSVPTLWTVFVVNFFALGLIWVYVMRAYPRLVAARFWAGTAFAAIVGAMLAILRNQVDSLLPLLVAGAVMVFAACLGWMGTQRFYGRPASWRASALLVAGTAAVLLFFIYFYDSRSMRTIVYSAAQALPLMLTLRLLLSPAGRSSPGAKVAAALILLFVAVYVGRIVGTLFGLDFTVGQSSTLAIATVLLLMFLSMAMNFGLLLMAVERLRSEVAELALLDDLTGVANRRHLMQRLVEECARSERSAVPFSLLVIDLDGFKAINDSHGHAAGDACLQVCREDALAHGGAKFPFTVSIGVAQWTAEIGPSPETLMLQADEALYAAKKEGKNRYAAYSSAPSVSPDAGDETDRPLLKRA